MLRAMFSFRDTWRGCRKIRFANVSQIVSVDKDLLTKRVGKLPGAKLELILAGVGMVLGK